ncbi:MAG: NAD(P)-dependent oxidoreductase [Rhodocyclaceae bacterium]|nr:NAD(P)-dependent oxidoreductase [Rhodocyclaceae bacterium]
MKLGFIGLGVMGGPMAQHLLRAGHELGVWARRPAAAQALVDAGAQSFPTPAALAEHVDVMFIAVTAGADVEQVALGADGLIHGARPGCVIVDHSTVAPATARALAARFAARGVDFLDAPVSGGGAGARGATLAIMVGGAAGALDRVRPLLDVLGTTIVHVGASGAGQVAKACNQLTMVAAIQACAEAARLAAAHGIDFGRVRAALLAGSAASRVLDVFGDKMARRDFRAGVEARLHHKDYAIAMDAAARAGCPLPLSAPVWQQLNALMARGLGGEDTAGLLRLLEMP